MPHGLTDSDYQKALADARETGNEHLVAVIQAAEEIVSLFEFAHLSSLAGLKRAMATAESKVEFLETYLEKNNLIP